MAIRDDLVSSAVNFLQDPSVANSPLDKRIAFLQSKNLTQEEIDAALARASEGASAQQQSGGFGYPQAQQQMVPAAYGAPPPPPQYGYGGYPGGYWGQQAAPEPPRRDWRDYFIMATVMSGLGYGVYFLVKRYISPLIAPPTPPQLESDKSSIDEQFARAFALIDQLTADTASIKSTEEARKTQLDTALTDLESSIVEMKNSGRRREDDARRINDEVRALQSMIPKAMQAQEETTDTRLKELNAELKSLKTLIANRMSGAGVAGVGVQRPASGAGAGLNGTSDPPAVTSPTAPAQESGAPPATAASATASAPDRSSSSSPFGRFGTRGGIPAWQMAASKKDEGKKDTGESGTVVDAGSEGVVSP